jgi:transposase
VQDRDGARLVLVQRTRRLFPFTERIFAYAGYPGWRVAAAVANAGSWTPEIVKRKELHRFVVLPKRWSVERTLAWISRNRRLARDFERYAQTVAAVKRNELHRVVAQTLDRRAHSRLDQPKPSLGARLRALRSIRGRLHRLAIITIMFRRLRPHLIAPES